MFAQHLPERLENFGQAARMFPVLGAGNRSLRERDGAGFFKADDAVAGAAQRRINAQDDLRREARDAGRGARDINAQRFAAEALLHLFELLPGNAHAKRLPAAARRQKQKRRQVALAAFAGNTGGEPYFSRSELRDGPGDGDGAEGVELRGVANTDGVELRGLVNTDGAWLRWLFSTGRTDFVSAGD